jgi:predicted RNA-binding protein with TRAM domain
VERNRRSLTPAVGLPAAGVHATRRAGARHEVSTRVALKRVRASGLPSSADVIDGWALNVSRGGVRVILEEKVELGDEFDVSLLDRADAGDGPASNRVQRGCIVWVQEENDGMVAGIAFKDAVAAAEPEAEPEPAGG